MNASPFRAREVARAEGPLTLTGGVVRPEPILFLPDLMADGRLFHRLVAAFSAHRPVQIATFAQGDTITQFADSVLANAPPRFALVGAGLGGNVALEIARSAPGRVSRLALIATNATADPPAVSAAREERLVLARSGRLRDAIRMEISPDDLAPGPFVWPVLSTVDEMACALGPQVYVRQTRALQRRSDRSRILRSLAVPSLVIGGEHDRLSPPEMQEELVRGARHGRLVLLDDAGHLPTLEAPEAVASALSDWLAAPLLLV